MRKLLIYSMFGKWWTSSHLLLFFFPVISLFCHYLSRSVSLSCICLNPSSPAPAPSPPGQWVCGQRTTNNEDQPTTGPIIAGDQNNEEAMEYVDRMPSVGLYPTSSTHRHTCRLKYFNIILNHIIIKKNFKAIELSKRLTEHQNNCSSDSFFAIWSHKTN